MEFVILGLLIVFVAIHYLPDILKQRTLDSPLETISEFNRGMTALGFSIFSKYPDSARNSVYSSIYSNANPHRGRQAEGRGNRSYYEREADFIPYPRSRARELMKTRQQRMLFLLFLLMLSTGIPGIAGSLEWLLYVHLAILVLSSVYVLMMIFLAGGE